MIRSLYLKYIIISFNSIIKINDPIKTIANNLNRNFLKDDIQNRVCTLEMLGIISHQEYINQNCSAMTP